MIHHLVMKSFVERGFPPTLAELARAMPDASDALAELHEQHGVVLHPGSREIWIAHPFSASPTATWVAGKPGWWAPCLWCAAGVVALTGDAAIHTRFGGEADAARIAAGDDILVHFALPARDAWNNVVHWCATVQPFRAERDVDDWCLRHRIARGAIVPWSRVQELARAWYGRYLDESWRKHTVAEAQAIFERVGLVGDHWRLSASSERF